MRVVGGRWGGRRLRAPRGDATRPTSDRVKEALFSILGARLSGRRIVDLFCGAGSLGVEALSRGAAHCTFVDRAGAALGATRGNLETLGAEPGEWAVVRGDALRWLEKELAVPGEPLVVFADPPYSAGALDDLVRIATSSPRTDMLILEHDAGDDVAEPSGWTRDARRYGGTGLTILERDS